MTSLTTLRKLGMASALASALIAVAPAHARRIGIDSTSQAITTVCTFGAACSATPISFSANLGSGTFSSLYIYSNGLVSIGSALSPSANLSSLSSIGGNVFTAGYSPSMTLSNFRIQDPATSQSDFFGRPVERITYDASFGSVTNVPMQFNLYDLGSHKYQLQFNYGDAFDASAKPSIASNAYAGYSIGGKSSMFSGVQLASLVASDSGGGGSLSFTLPSSATSTVPEPATWALMIVGLGIVGASLRRQRTYGSVQPSLA